MGKMSRDKGKRFERHLASIFRKYGYADARRTAQYCGKSGDAADVEGLPGIHVEAKHQEKMRLYEWMDQAIRDAIGTGKRPVVFHKKNNHEILVTMQLDTFFELYREWESGRYLEDKYGQLEKHKETCKKSTGKQRKSPQQRQLSVLSDLQVSHAVKGC